MIRKRKKLLKGCHHLANSRYQVSNDVDFSHFVGGFYEHNETCVTRTVALHCMLENIKLPHSIQLILKYVSLPIEIYINCI